MKVHHLNCGTMAAPGAAIVCHVLLVETDNGLVLVDSGFGLKDCADPTRIGPSRHLLRPTFDADETADGQHIDLGWDRPVSYKQLAALSAAQLGTPVTVRHIPWPLLNVGMRLIGALDSRSADSRGMFAFFQTGRFVADPTAHERFLGPVPTAEDAISRCLRPQVPADTAAAP